jgi:hypothetical protein
MEPVGEPSTRDSDKFCLRSHGIYFFIILFRIQKLPLMDMIYGTHWTQIGLWIAIRHDWLGIKMLSSKLLVISTQETNGEKGTPNILRNSEFRQMGYPQNPMVHLCVPHFMANSMSYTWL